jgi:hypothetical protein
MDICVHNKSEKRWSAVFQLELLLGHITKLSHSNAIGFAITLVKLLFRKLPFMKLKINIKLEHI